MNALKEREAVLQEVMDELEMENKYLILNEMTCRDPRHMDDMTAENGYVALSVVKFDERRGERVEEELTEETLRGLWDDNTTKRVVVVGAAGSGKTTLMQYVAQADLWDRFKVKIYIRLGRVKGAQSLEDIVLF